MTAIIQIQDLVQNYGGKAPVLDHIRLDIGRGEFVALVGQNGAGKSTLVKHFNGLLRPDSGRVLVCGRDTQRVTTACLAQQVGYVFQNPDHQIFLERVDKEVAFGPGNLGLNAAEVECRTVKALEQTGLTRFREAAPHSLSKGQRQRVAFASVLAMEPEILVLDEPTTGQDYRESLQIMDLVAELNRMGHTVIFITHDMQLVASYAGRVIMMGKGRVLADGTPREVLPRTDLLAATFLKPPQITQLAQALNDCGFAGDAIRVEELVTVFREKTCTGRHRLAGVG